jgi:hypothetical protein
MLASVKILLLWLVIVKGTEEEDSGKLKDDTEGGVYAQAVAEGVIAPNTTAAEAIIAADLLQAVSFTEEMESLADDSLADEFPLVSGDFPEGTTAESDFDFRFPVNLSAGAVVPVPKSLGVLTVLLLMPPVDLNFNGGLKTQLMMCSVCTTKLSPTLLLSR